MPTTVSVLATVVDPQGALRVDVVTGTGFNLTFDTGNAGELRAGAGPTESLLAVLAGCTSMDVGSILRKKRQPAASYRIAVTAEKADEHPQVYTSIVIEHQVSGEVQPEALRRAIELSATAYCPVSAMLSRAVRIEHRYRLAREGSEVVSALVAITGPEGAQLL
ncbi:MAG: OsmC family protein [Chloroflexota bacterium]|nr:OsmC family protein [Chloroflexota bacterium]